MLVFKYRGTTLPERRVDVYHELVELLLGFWDTHRAVSEGTSDVRELVLVDGTGRTFMDEHDAVEAKARALTDLADWMQRNQLAEVSQLRAAARLARFFRIKEGASRAEDKAWACNFLAVAHQRSGLFIEAQPGTFAFSHQNFREYLAAKALIGNLDRDLVRLVLANARDPWWEEVILLGIAHPNLSESRREYLLEEMLSAGHLLLAARCAVDAGARLPEPMRRQIRRALHARMIDAGQSPTDRHAAGEVLDQLGWLPDDLNQWVHCSECAEGGGDLMAARYPVTNAQFERFIEDGGYQQPVFWGGEQSAAWQWRIKDHPDYRGSGPVTQPEYWREPRFGRDRTRFSGSWRFLVRGRRVSLPGWAISCRGRARADQDELEAADRNWWPICWRSAGPGYAWQRNKNG